jgi:Leucine-rich repeat (LRR) protein
LTSLQLWSNQLVILPIQIVELKNLTELYLSGNQLTSLPAQIGELKNLISLYLGGNQLTSLPAQIAALKNLARLDLSNNQLTTLPAQIGELKKLTALYLDGNRLTALPPQIRELRKLEVLNLGYNNIEKVAVQIGDLKNLTELNLSQNRVFAAERKTILALLPDCEIVFAEDYSKMANRYHVNGDYAEAFKAQQKVVEKDGKNYSNWFTLSFYALFIGEPQKAIQAAKHVLALNPEAVDVETNLALGYLLNNQWAEAEAIYLKWKGKNFPDDNRLWDLVFLAEIADLEKTGIIHPDFEKVKKIFGK